MNRFVILLLFALILSMIGCKTEDSVVKKYYVLEAPEDTTFVDTTAEEFINEFCEVEKVDLYPAFETRKIANRRHSHEITYYSSHEWAVRPAEVLTTMLVDFMDKKRIFNRVATRFWKVSPAYKIETTIYKLEVVNDDNVLAAHLHLEFRLVKGNTQEIITKHQFDQYESLEEKQINIFASSISKMFYSALDDFSTRIYKSIKEGSKTETETETES
ncbi:MAG: ABC-type transport auxiliary lipoprotein family protein [Bacteroidota bacterium]